MSGPWFWNSAVALLLSFWGAYTLTSMLVEPLRRTFEQGGFVRTNFRGDPIPVGLGAALWLGLSATGILLLLLGDVFAIPWAMLHDIIGLLVVGTALFALGLLDDAVGTRDAMGLRGHVLKLLREGVLTTGLVKAGAGLLVGLLGAWLLGAQGWRLVLDAFVIALSANSVNLLDLRPGRACKGVLLALCVLVPLSLHGGASPLFYLMLGAMFAYMPADLRGGAMMGDAGSNLLGGALGVFVVTTCSWKVALGWLVVLAVLHLYAERYSLSETIEKNRLLRWLDVLGRGA
jgi:UDP-GlcNAc:undecaprenyl-phosphate/decaprenyl-phosphate GlcNAc-1-phosphate transferase